MHKLNTLGEPTKPLAKSRTDFYSMHSVRLAVVIHTENKERNSLQINTPHQQWYVLEAVCSET